jgi:hydrogenase expression/formation protein
MTEGAGGGTITAAALYSGHPEVVEHTINLSFLQACEALLASPALSRVHAMTDVTNGGLRGDVHEMSTTARCRIVVEDRHLRSLVQPQVLALLDTLSIDYLGVSLDALLVSVPPEEASLVQEVLGKAGVRMEVIGHVEKGEPEAVLVVDGQERDFTPRFRESAYTPLKKVVDRTPADFEALKERVDRAAEEAKRKKERILHRLRRT